jgi:hypothetical protein
MGAAKKTSAGPGVQCKGARTEQGDLGKGQPTPSIPALAHDGLRHLLLTQRFG